MKYDDRYINSLLDECVKFSDELGNNYHYPDNIVHLLYLIIPAFILKYGTNNKELVKKCFNDVIIRINDKQDKVYQAYYFSTPKLVDGGITTVKGIVLNNYNNISLMQLIDNLVHEYNHAINSLQNEVIIRDNIMIRTGIVYNYFNKSNLSFIKKGEEIILEEVINTRQTELIINLIKDFNNYNISNSTVESTLYSINNLASSGYKSDGYYLESMVCKKLLDNKTFISTLEILRFDGQIDDIHHFFDSIVGKNNSLLELSKYLKQSLDLQHQLSKTKLFKKIKINKIREINTKALEIVNKFNDNSIYK